MKRSQRRNPKKICIDATPIGLSTDDKGGVYHYITNFLLQLKQMDSENEYVLFFNISRRKHLGAFRRVAGMFDDRRNFALHLTRFPQRIWRALRVPLNAFVGSLDIFHGLNSDLLPVRGCKTVVTVHDLRALVLPDTDSFDHSWLRILENNGEGMKAKRKKYRQRLSFFRHRRKHLPESIRRADKIIAISEFTKSSIRELFDIPEEKIAVVYPGLSERFMPVRDNDAIGKVLDVYGIKRKYLLYVGKLDPLKNIERLLEAFDSLRKETAVLQDYQLVLAGPRTLFGDIIMHRIRELGLENWVVVTDFIHEKDLPLLYSGAEVFVLPSLFEGFGIPLIEAMACGCPIVASNVCSIPEVVGRAAMLFDPYSVSEIKDAVSRVLLDDGTKDRLIKSGLERAKQFSWEKTVENTLRIYMAGL